MRPTEGTRQDVVRVVLVDNEPIVRSGIGQMLARSPELKVIGEASDAEEGVAQAVMLRPDVVILEARLDGQEATATIREIDGLIPRVGTLVFSSYPEVRLAIECIRAGAGGYLLKRASADRLVDAILTVGRGEAIADPWLTHHVFKAIRDSGWQWSREHQNGLSRRDSRMLSLVAEGRSNREIAAELHLAEQTVKNQLSMLLHRLGIARRVLVSRYLDQVERATY